MIIIYRFIDSLMSLVGIILSMLNSELVARKNEVIEKVNTVLEYIDGRNDTASLQLDSYKDGAIENGTGGTVKLVPGVPIASAGIWVKLIDISYSKAKIEYIELVYDRGIIPVAPKPMTPSALKYCIKESGFVPANPTNFNDIKSIKFHNVPPKLFVSTPGTGAIYPEGGNPVKLSPAGAAAPEANIDTATRSNHFIPLGIRIPEGGMSIYAWYDAAYYVAGVATANIGLRYIL